MIIQTNIKKRRQQFQVVEVLSKHAGLWITRDKEIMYSQVGSMGYKGVTDFGHLRILENMLSEATKLRALCFLKLFLLVLMVGSENSRGHV